MEGKTVCLNFFQLTVDGLLSLAGVVALEHVEEALNIAPVVVPSHDQLMAEKNVTDPQDKQNGVELDTVQVSIW